MFLLRAFLCCLALAGVCRAADEGLNFTEKRLEQLSERSTTRYSTQALSLHPETWKHAETANFIYHYQSDYVAKPVASEAEFYYRVIAEELDRETEAWQRKCHIYLFESDEAWAEFQKVGGLEPWTGGIHVNNELFMPRDPKRKFKGNTVAHEVTHLVLNRFFGSGIPLWMNEGLAEYSASRWYAAYMRSRGYLARPYSVPVDPQRFIPLEQFTQLQEYPAQVEQVFTFYAEAEKLVRFLSAADKRKFAELLEMLSKGARFDSALDRAFGAKFFNVAALEKEFKAYASKDFSP